MGNPIVNLTVLVHDSHDATRLGLGVVLQRQPWIVRCLLAEDQTTAIALAQRHRPDVAIVDISNAAPFAATIARALHEVHPAVQIVLSSRCATNAGAPVESLGAVGFLAPTASHAEIVRAVRAAALAEPATRPAPGQPGPGLTERERLVLSLISTGATNREIAAQLHLGPDSIKKTATAIYRKIGVRNRAEASKHAAAMLGT
jgi:DNA-binding NarL/FixJ family response regulator